MIKNVFEVSDKVKNNRTPSTVLLHLVQEIGELSTEIQIEEGHIQKTPSDDGIVGEAIDVIICALDIIRIHNPEITEEEIISYCQKKLNKWLKNENEKAS